MNEVVINPNFLQALGISVGGLLAAIVGAQRFLRMWKQGQNELAGQDGAGQIINSLRQEIHNLNEDRERDRKERQRDREDRDRMHDLINSMTIELTRTRTLLIRVCELLEHHGIDVPHDVHGHVREILANSEHRRRKGDKP